MQNEKRQEELARLGRIYALQSLADKILDTCSKYLPEDIEDPTKIEVNIHNGYWTIDKLVQIYIEWCRIADQFPACHLGDGNRHSREARGSAVRLCNSASYSKTLAASDSFDARLTDQVDQFPS